MAYLQSAHVPLQLLDVITKSVKKESPVALLKASKILSHGGHQESAKINARTLQKLNEIFISLSAERNPERLLATILANAIELSGAEGGITFMIQETDGDMYFRYRIQDKGGREVHLEEINTRVVELVSPGLWR